MKGIAMKIGIDFGGVISDRYTHDNTPTSFRSERYLETGAMPGAIDALRNIVEMFTPENVFITSRASFQREQKTLHWLFHHRVHQSTGLLEKNVLFCRERYEKLDLALQENISIMIDDRLEVLGYLIGRIKHLILFHGEDSEIMKHAEFLPRVKRIMCWDEVVRHLEHIRERNK